MTDGDGDLGALAEEVGSRLADHARVCTDVEARPEDVARAGEAAVSALLAYERRLGVLTGWSNPLRHLGPVPVHDGLVDDRSAAEGALLGTAVVTYRVAVSDDVGLGHLVEGRGGDAPPDLAGALRALIHQDGWDPESYPSGLITLLAADVDVTIDGNSAAEI